MSRSPDLVGNRTLSDVISSIKKPKLDVDTAWYKVGATEQGHNVNFTNSATNYPGATNAAPPVSWYFSEDGEIRLRGRVQAAQGVMFRLPPEARPEFSQTFICATETGDDETEAHISLDSIKFRSHEEEPEEVEA